LQETCANEQGLEFEVANSLGMKLRLIPPGVFLMGSQPGEIGRGDDELLHRVQLTSAFYLGRCEVTQREYQALMGSNPSLVSPNSPDEKFRLPETGQHPVDNVSWFDAVDFCNKLSVQENLAPHYLRQGNTVSLLSGNGYRLPTEAEWEYACRAGTTTTWSFGNDEARLTQYAWIGKNSHSHPVGQLTANAFGLFDMHGNICEWCWDWHEAYAPSAVSDPLGPESGPHRLLRGATFNGLPSFARSANRHWLRPTFQYVFFGFRVARSCP
jgi:formylglycine-generating enzyme required for sulfatase activity